MDWQTYAPTHFKKGDQAFLRRWQANNQIVGSVAYYNQDGERVESSTETVEVPFPTTIPIDIKAFFEDFDEKLRMSRFWRNASSVRHAGEAGWADPANGFWRSTRNNLQRLWKKLIVDAGGNDDDDDFPDAEFEAALQGAGGAGPSAAPAPAPEPPEPPEPPAPPPPPPPPPPATLQTNINSWLQGATSAAAPPAAAPAAPSNAAGKKKVVTIPTPSRSHQLEHYCGNIPELMEYATQKHGQAGKGGMDEAAIHRWYRMPGHWKKYIPKAFQHLNFGRGNDDLQVCHIVAVHVGGHPWPYNYVIATGKVNNHFKQWFTPEWREYIGEQAYNHATSFQRWAVLATQATLPNGKFDPILDRLLAKRKR